MANLMKNPIEWRKRDSEKLAVANALRKHLIDVERQKAYAIAYTRNVKMLQM